MKSFELKMLSQGLFTNLPDWVQSINVSDDGLAYGFSCHSEHCYINKDNQWDFLKEYNGDRWSVLVGFRFTGLQILDKELK